MLIRHNARFILQASGSLPRLLRSHGLAKDTRFAGGLSHVSGSNASVLNASAQHASIHVLAITDGAQLPKAVIYAGSDAFRSFCSGLLILNIIVSK